MTRVIPFGSLSSSFVSFTNPYPVEKLLPERKENRSKGQKEMHEEGLEPSSANTLRP